MNYSKMSDHQINVLVAKALDGHEDDKFPVQRRLQVFDPCNSWSDAGPIIQENKIDINWTMQRGKVSQSYARNSYPRAMGKSGYIHSNPLRAAMIVFLMMQEAK